MGDTSVMKGEIGPGEAHTACMSPTTAIITKETALVAFSGELDFAAQAEADVVVRELLAQGTREILVDLADVTFMDCAGLGILVHAARRAERHGARMYLVRARGQVRELIDWAAACGYSVDTRRSSARRAAGFAISDRDAIAA